MSQSECISWVKCTSWLSNFLNRRGLRQPDSRPLYEYHATNDEYNNLTQLLRAVGQVQSYIDDKGYAACFVLFGNDSNLLIVFYVQIVPDDFVMQLHR
ncbi:hypothetical protein WCV47_28620, partial [Klebsiella pneumoniae]